MDFNQVLQSRRSVKSFKQEEIPQSMIDKILNAARIAPSWGNNQCWKLVMVKNKDTISAIANALINDNSAQKGVKEAPLLVVACAEPSKSAKVNNMEYYLVDSAIAMDHLILAAQNEGLGTCWIGQFDENAIKSILSIPNHYRVVALTPVGFSSEAADTEEKRQINDIAFTDRWGEYLH